MIGSTSVLQPWDDACPNLIAFCDALRERLREVDGRARARTPRDAEAYSQTLTAVAVSIANIALRQLPPAVGVPISFNERAYSGSGISVTALRSIRDGLEALGLVQVTRGFYDREGRGQSKATQLLPTAEFAEIAGQCGLRVWDVNRPPCDVICMNQAVQPVSPMPDDVAASEEVVRALNSLNARHSLSLPDDATRRVIAIMADGLGKGGSPIATTGYDECAIYLKRIFKYDWCRGGRLYGGFWQNLPREERANLLIDGEATAELDYVTLHPRILYANVARALDFDPYLVPGFDVPRGMGKRTFNRLLNGSWDEQMVHPLAFRSEDRECFSSRAEFRAYVASMRGGLSGIGHYLGSALGLELQRRDSELALDVISRCIGMDFPIYPIHDSFVVRVGDFELARREMYLSFERMFSQSAEIRVAHS